MSEPGVAFARRLFSRDSLTNPDLNRFAEDNPLQMNDLHL
jgi:hypothetical protein